MKRAALAILLLVASASTAVAQAPKPQPVIAQAPKPKPAPQKTRALELRGFLVVGSEQTESPKTFDAILGSERLLFIGGGGELILAGRWILRGQVAQFSDTGTRVFVDNDDTVFPLNIPLRITVRATEFSGGYRFFVKPRWAVYAAGGVTQYALTERSNDERERTDGRGWHVLGGADVKPRKWLMLAGEGQWTRTGDMLEAGAAEALGESRLGGIRISARIGFAF